MLDDGYDDLTGMVASMNGLTINAQMSLDELPTADAGIVGSVMKTREYAADPAFLASLRLDLARQIVGSQCSGALLLASFACSWQAWPAHGCAGLHRPHHKPWVVEDGANVVHHPFFAAGKVATAGGCPSS